MSNKHQGDSGEEKLLEWNQSLYILTTQRFILSESNYRYLKFKPKFWLVSDVISKLLH